MSMNDRDIFVRDFFFVLKNIKITAFLEAIFGSKGFFYTLANNYTGRITLRGDHVTDQEGIAYTSIVEMFSEVSDDSYFH